MKNFFEKKYLQIGAVLLIVSIIAITFCYLIHHWGDVSAFFSTTAKILSPIIDGLIIAFLLIPIVNFIEHRLSYIFVTPKKKQAIMDKREAPNNFNYFNPVVCRLIDLCFFIFRYSPD